MRHPQMRRLESCHSAASNGLLAQLQAGQSLVISSITRPITAPSPLLQFVFSLCRSQPPHRLSLLFYFPTFRPAVTLFSLFYDDELSFTPTFGKFSLALTPNSSGPSKTFLLRVSFLILFQCWVRS